MMKALDPNFADLINCFNSRNVRYMVLGGYAVNIHGHHRNTLDLDVWIAVDPENLSRVSSALVAFGFSPEAVDPSILARPDRIFAFGRSPLRVDILTQPSGVDFETAYARHVEVDVDGTRLKVISLADLRTNKRASGRPKDIGDLENLPEG